MLRISGTLSPTGRGEETASLPIPTARFEPLMQMHRRRCGHADRIFVLRNRDHQFARMQMQPRFAETGAVAVDIIADNRPAHRGSMHPQLMRPPGDRLQRQPGETLATPE